MSFQTKARMKKRQKMEDYTPDASQASRVIFFNAVFADAIRNLMLLLF